MLTSTPSIPLTLLAALVLGSLAPAVADADPRFVDEVGTLELDATLDARGNLGGLTIDRLGYVYVANFRDKLWRVSPRGHVKLVTDALYGASGIAVDAQGRIYQADFLADTITRIERTGEVSTFASGDGLDGPVGLVASPNDDSLYVCNCRGNEVVRVLSDGSVEPFATSDLFACPNGITFGPDDTLYVTSFNGPDVVSITADGEAARFASIPGGAGNAHIAHGRGFFYVTKLISHRVVKVSEDGQVHPLAGTGQPGHDDGSGPEASLHAPNGIAFDAAAHRLYVGTMVGKYARPEPSRLTIRTIDLANLTDVLTSALEDGGIEAARETYRAYREDPVRGLEDTSAELIAFAYSRLSERKVPEALALFEMNAETYPEDVNARFHLGEAYRYVGRIDDARTSYRRVLELAPDHAGARARLALIDGR